MVEVAPRVVASIAGAPYVPPDPLSQNPRDCGAESLNPPTICPAPLTPYAVVATEVGQGYAMVVNVKPPIPAAVHDRALIVTVAVAGVAV